MRCWTAKSNPGEETSSPPDWCLCTHRDGRSSMSLKWWISHYLFFNWLHFCRFLALLWNFSRYVVVMWFDVFKFFVRYQSGSTTARRITASWWWPHFPLVTGWSQWCQQNRMEIWQTPVPTWSFFQTMEGQEHPTSHTWVIKTFGIHIRSQVDSFIKIWLYVFFFPLYRSN